MLHNVITSIEPYDTVRSDMTYDVLRHNNTGEAL